MSKILKEEIAGIEQIAKSIYKMTIKSEYISQNSKPGQFVNIKCSEGINALLRRPISICSVNREKETFDICFQIRGIGTEYLSKKLPGDVVDVIGPLGKTFDISDEYKEIAVVGGGIGVFPLLFLLREKKCDAKYTYLGFRSEEFITLLDDFKDYSNSVSVSTDDGTYGYKGLVTDLLEKDLQSGKLDIIYTCGPIPMVRKVVEIAEKYNVKCQVSLEQRMGCGIGACLVCACKTKIKDDTNDGWVYKHVCKDGPVFWSDEVIFE